jgi:hypothetical protein
MEYIASIFNFGIRRAVGFTASAGSCPNASPDWVQNWNRPIAEKLSACLFFK